MTTTFPRPAGLKGAPVPALWRDLSVTPFQLVRLKRDVNSQFKAGTIVSLSDEAEDSSYNSPTKRPGQEQENKDMTSTVRIYKLVRRETTVDIHTMPGRTIKHAHLRALGSRVSQDTFIWDTSALVEVHSVGETEYKTAVYPPRPGPNQADAKSYNITNGMIGYVVECRTPTGVIVQPGNMSRSSFWSYVVRFTILEKEHVWVPCQRAVSVLALEALTPSETATAKNRIMKTQPGKTTREFMNFRPASVNDYDVKLLN